MFDWCPGRESNPYSHKPRDFKSLVSTNFTTRAGFQFNEAPKRKRESALRFPFEFGAAEESRTLDLNLGKVALYQLSYCRKFWRREPESNRPTRICNPVHNRFAIAPFLKHFNYSDEYPKVFAVKLERQKSLELSTSTLARLRSTN